MRTSAKLFENSTFILVLVLLRTSLGKEHGFSPISNLTSWHQSVSQLPFTLIYKSSEASSWPHTGVGFLAPVPGKGVVHAAAVSTVMRLILSETFAPYMPHMAGPGPTACRVPRTCSPVAYHAFLFVW